jgi:hypothetical protein
MTLNMLFYTHQYFSYINDEISVFSLYFGGFHYYWIRIWICILNADPGPDVLHRGYDIYLSVPVSIFHNLSLFFWFCCVVYCIQYNSRKFYDFINCTLWSIIVVIALGKFLKSKAEFLVFNLGVLYYQIAYTHPPSNIHLILEFHRNSVHAAHNVVRIMNKD